MFLLPEILTAAILLKIASKTGEREISKAFGKKFALLNENDYDCFEKLWDQYWDAQKFKKDHKEEIQAEVDQAFHWLETLANCSHIGRQPDHNLPFGHKSACWADYNQRYVIFSDHHMMHQHPGVLGTAHRHDIFSVFPNHREGDHFINRIGNRYLYADALRQYYNSNYTLVENGDVEDLVIFEPNFEDVKARKKMNDEELREHKFQYRLRQLQAIMHTYDDLYIQIHDTFQSHGRYIRLAGNHDQDLQKPAFTHQLRTRYPDINVYDYLMLYDPREARDGDRPRYIIGHGHQFDINCTPKFAPKQGEVFSESLAWAFQGADRNWRWEDGPSRWADRFPFVNELVKGDKRPGEEFIAGRLDGVDDLIEVLFGCEIAWEYFENDSALNAFLQEVCTGEEFFKYRHLDELETCNKYHSAFQHSGRIPTLVLGHSHEPRANAINQRNNVVPFYANSGTAGRFENLLWCVEIEGDNLRVVSWHFDQLLDEIPQPGQMHRPPVRTVYEPFGGQLVPIRVERLG